MQRFRSVRHTQRFPSTYSRIYNYFQLRRHRLTANEDAPPATLPSAPSVRLP